jgi:diguanylate cyclase (GGDEF)-like protein/PAS domain S-box-containing protein
MGSGRPHILRSLRHKFRYGGGSAGVLAAKVGLLLRGGPREGAGVESSRAVERRSAEALARFETIYRKSPMGIGLLGLDGVWLETNDAMRQVTGYDADELSRVPLRKRVHPDEWEGLAARTKALLDGEVDVYRAEVRSVHKDGHLVWTDSLCTLVRDEDGKPAYQIVMSQDITKRKEAEEALARQAELNEYQALHDGLTGLPNRILFRDRIGQAIHDAERNGGSLAVLMMDLDRFKEVNDSLGHHAGDMVLGEIGERLQQVLRASDGAARLGGDEFAFLVVKPCDRDDVVRVIVRIQDALGRPFVVHGRTLSIEASIGAAFYPDDGRDVDRLLQRADAAMYVAKAGSSRYAFYDETDAGRYLSTPVPS